MTPPSTTTSVNSARTVAPTMVTTLGTTSTTLPCGPSDGGSSAISSWVSGSLRRSAVSADSGAVQVDESNDEELEEDQTADVDNFYNPLRYVPERVGVRFSRVAISMRQKGPSFEWVPVPSFPDWQTSPNYNAQMRLVGGGHTRIFNYESSGFSGFFCLS